MAPRRQLLPRPRKQQRISGPLRHASPVAAAVDATAAAASAAAAVPAAAATRAAGVGQGAGAGVCGSSGGGGRTRSNHVHGIKGDTAAGHAAGGRKQLLRRRWLWTKNARTCLGLVDAALGRGRTVLCGAADRLSPCSLLGYLANQTLGGEALIAHAVTDPAANLQEARWTLCRTDSDSMQPLRTQTLDLPCMDLPPAPMHACTGSTQCLQPRGPNRRWRRSVAR